MDRRKFLTGAVVAITPAIAGCGGGGNGNGGGGGNGNADGETTPEPAMTTEEPAMTTAQTMTTTEESSMTTTEESLPSSVTVELENTAFTPKTVEVAVGGTVEWANKDGYGHDVTSAQFSDGAASWDYSKSLSGGGTVSFTFDSAGFYEYYCTIHGRANMCGVVVVGDTDYTGSLPCAGGGGGAY